MKKINILGTNVCMVDMAGAISKVEEFLTGDKANAVFTPNSEIIMSATRDEEFKSLLNSADLVIADGIGVVYASRILKKPLAERVAGFDLVSNIIKKSADGKHSFYFFGGKPGVSEKAKENLQKEYPLLNVVGTSDGYFDAEKEKQIIADIKEKAPDIVFVCLGAIKQEKWIMEHKDELGAKVLFGVGGSLDVFAGNAERAPLFYQKAGLEWFYRLMKEPKRIIRMMDLPRFALKVIKEGKKYPQED